MLEFRTLGTVDLRADGGRSLRSVLAHPKRVALLAYLTAVHPTRLQRRATLTTLLWPELDDAHARGALRQELYSLRRSLGAGVLVGEGEDMVGVDAERLWCDARAFEANVEAGRPAPALELYHGEFLPGLHVGGGEFERWVDEARARLARHATEAARQLACEAEKAGDLGGAVSWTHRLIEVAPYDETGWRHLIRLLDRSGDRAGALIAYDSLVASLRSELEVEPSPETQELVERIRERAEAFALPVEAVPPDGGGPPPRGSTVSSPATRPDAARPGAGRPRHSRALVVAASTVALVAVIGAALFLAPAGPRRPLAPARPVIGLMPVENQTGESGFNALGQRVTDRLGQGLARAGFADVVFGAGRADLTAIVSATLYRRGELVEVLPRLAEPGAGGRLVEMPGAVLLSPDDPDDAALDSLVGRVLASVASHYDPRFEVALTPERDPVIETPSWEAYQEYVQGSELFGLLGFGEAARRMLRAHEIDPGFVKAALFAGIALTYAGRPRAADSVATAAMAEAPTLTPYERAFGDWLLADLHGRRPEAYRAAREFARLGPSSPTLFLAGREALRMNRPREAVRVLQSIDLERGWFRNWTEYWEVLDGALHVIGEHRTELSTALAGRARFPEALTLIRAEIRARSALGQSREVSRLLDEAMTLPPGQISPAEVARAAALELSVHGHESAAAAARRRGLEWVARQGSGSDEERSLRSWLLLETGDLKRTCRTPEPPAADVEGLGLAGMLAARCGDTAAAHDAIARLEAWPDPYASGRHLFFAAGIRAALGQPEEAVTTLRRALAAGLPFGVDLHASAMLLPLSGRAAFAALMRPRE